MTSQQHYDETDITTKELDKLHKTYKNIIDSKKESDSDNGNTESDSDSDSDSDFEKPKFTVKAVEKLSSKKETTMLYMFKKYERLQNECNVYKNKLFKMRIRANSNEQTQHYKNLEFSNLLVEKQKLQEQLNRKRYTTLKYYISLTLNIILTSGAFWLYHEIKH